ncbi:hypothetical protein GCM10010508_58720 [Streptomyces naganishii JCM 4654]|uniref:Uncharacterized protein n=1 Tax=Streptomyces naganishii JCM 4654 TaxID=1306179 RepID=A0A918Y8T1_9ACTN|nr:hypothetical protein GCM10010508_58720 [Streptomyces naganishii JCM 4654]
MLGRGRPADRRAQSGPRRAGGKACRLVPPGGSGALPEPALLERVMREVAAGLAAGRAAARGAGTRGRPGGRGCGGA